jgi:pyrroline-5-carboxylate reductase
VRDLFLVVLISPIIYFLIKRLKFVFVLITAFVWLCWHKTVFDLFGVLDEPLAKIEIILPKDNNLEKLDLKKLDLVVISIAAGKTISNLRQIFGEQKFIRVMPNTPALISCGATAIARGENVDEETFSNVKKVFVSIGVVEEIKEDKMNEIIPINGSMPAYLYYFVQAFIEQGVKDGIDYEVAKKLACEAVIGSAKMILETDKSIDQLIKDVCSPGGATLEGLYVFENEKFKETIYKASIACVNKAYDLSK